MSDTQVADRGYPRNDLTKITTFYSYSGGVGRSCTVANIALILANLGYRVLAVDQDLRSPSLHRYLGVFLPPSAEPPSTLPVRLQCSFARDTGAVDLLGPTADVVADPEAFTVTREDLLGKGYDYVLIDSPTGVSEQVEYATGVLADILVVGYNLSSQSIAGAVQRARAVRQQAVRRPVRILPVPMRVDVRAHGSAERARNGARQQFAWLLQDLPEQRRRQYWRDVEIPYEPDYSLEEGLPVLDESSDQRNALLDSYRRLTAVPGARQSREVRLWPAVS